MNTRLTLPQFVPQSLPVNHLKNMNFSNLRRVRRVRQEK